MELSNLTCRVKFLNLVGSVLWPEPVHDNFKQFPVSRYEGLTIGADVFLMRYVSIVDCALLLANEVFECGFEPRRCSGENLRKAGIPATVAAGLDALLNDQGALRQERISRFHHGSEHGFTPDDLTFQSAALFEHRGSGGLRVSGVIGLWVPLWAHDQRALPSGRPPTFAPDWIHDDGAATKARDNECCGLHRCALTA